MPETVKVKENVKKREKTNYYGDGTSNGKQQDFFNKMIFPIW